MIYPIVAFGMPVLKTRAKEIDRSFPNLQKLISDMYETMYNAGGVGLAAPQIGISVRIFITDGKPFEEEPEVQDFKQVFINPTILKSEGNPWKFNEGCLSIPGIREDVERQPKILMRYQDEQFATHEVAFSGLKARIIQHEYDHLEGLLFTDRLAPLRRRLLKNKLLGISKGIVDVEYKMTFPK